MGYRTNPDKTATRTIHAFRDDPAWAELEARGGRWFQLSNADLKRLAVCDFDVTGDPDAVDDFDPESVRADAEAKAGGPVVLIY